MKDERERITHPSFGLVLFSRTNGYTRVFGSELVQHNYITLTISSAEIERSMSMERYCDTRRAPLIKVRMSTNQFSELITSMNIGSGVPCTIESIKGEKVEALPEIESKKEYVHKEFQNRMNEFASTLREKQAKIKAISAKKTLTKEDQKEIEGLTSWIIQETTKNIPFFAQCFQETCDKLVVEAKTEIEGALMHKVTTLGLKAYHESNPEQPKIEE